MYNIPDETLDTIAALGFDVYQNPDPHWRSYAYFTDGKHIGYFENDRFRGFKLSTVHIANKSTGTGFGLTDGTETVEFTREGLERAFIGAPVWANSVERDSVRKFDNMEHFLKCSFSQVECVRNGIDEYPHFQRSEDNVQKRKIRIDW